jgi:hypothetical protein
MKLNNFYRVCLLAVMAMPLSTGLGQTNVPPVTASPTVATGPMNDPGPPLGLPSNTSEVIKLSKAGVGDAVVLAYVRSSRYPYHLKADEVLQLKDAGVSSEIITAMLNHDGDLLKQSTGQASNPPAPYVYNQQLFPAGSQTDAGQPVAQPPPAQPPVPDATQLSAPTQAPGAPPPDVSASPAPPPQVEVVPVAPGPDYYWAPGYWGWNGGWIWIGGGWYPHGGYGWGYRGGYGGYRGAGGVRFGGGGLRGGVGLRVGHR